MKYEDRGRPRAGIVAALSGLRSEASPACGEFPDLALLGKLAASWDFGLVQLLPVNDTGSTPSPYMALSAFALHPLFISLGALPEAAPEGPAAPIVKKAQVRARKRRDEERLDYGSYYDEKLRVLRDVFDLAYGTGIADPGSARDLDRALAGIQGYPDWLEANAWVKPYAIFSELKRREGGKPWWEWSSHSTVTTATLTTLWSEPELVPGTRFNAWLQFRAEEQFGAATQSLRAGGIELLGDIPILIAKDSADVWADRAIFRLDVSAGSPPDGENPLGQSWGFPAYNWRELEARNYDFWRKRLAVAARHYSAYRIDHVLGFFRLWTSGARERNAWLGHFLPTLPVSRAELAALGFDDGRVRWLSRPHLPLSALRDAAGGNGQSLDRAISTLLDRIGNEELFLFRADILGEEDIHARLGDLPGQLCECLCRAWRDRALLEIAPDSFVATPAWRDSTSGRSLSGGERDALGRLVETRGSESMGLHEGNGRKILEVLTASSDMLATAEDLGGIPPYVPRVLESLDILGLRVQRWTRRWNERGQPFVPLSDYPEASVACPSVHDSSSLRQWWEREADQEAVWSCAAEALGLVSGNPPPLLGCAEARFLNEALASSASRIVVFPIQDLLAMSGAWRGPDPAAERVNVPGTDNAWNWGYRIPGTLEGITADGSLAEAARAVAGRRRGQAPGRTGATVDDRRTLPA